MSSPRLSLSSPPAGPVRSGTRREARGAAEPSDSAVTPSRAVAYSLSPSIHAREVRALASGQLGAGLRKDPLTGPELAPVLVVCTVCRQSIRRNEVLGISFCPAHGLSEPFTFIPLAQKRLPGA